MKRPAALSLCYAGDDGTVYELTGRAPAFRTGRRFVPADPGELIPLPGGSVLFTLPGRRPVRHRHRDGSFAALRRAPDGTPAWAVSSFLSSAYLRTYLPAFIKEPGAPELSLWAYGAVVMRSGRFMAPALRIDDDVRSDPAQHANDDELAAAIPVVSQRLPGNRLVGQLARCATDYRCLCARNFFLSRHEAPVPTATACNARCTGCLSHQDPAAGVTASQQRLDFAPTPDEIAGIITHHFARVERAVASFGQGCEGEPLTRGRDLARAIALVRKTTGAGTINLNTNGSLPDMVKLMIDAGLDSIRISMNSPTPAYYERYYRPQGYVFDDVLRSIDVALTAGIFVSLNLFFLPGFTDDAAEVEALRVFLRRFPVSMIQTRNLNMDPDQYLDAVGFEESDPIGVRRLLDLLRREFPAMRLGYYNPPLR